MNVKTVSTLSVASVLSLASFVFQNAANAAILRIDQSAFQPTAGLITFSEVPMATVNPVYTPTMYGGNANSPTVSFGGAFTGQTVGQSPFPPGAAPSGVVNGTPTGPISLNPNSPATRVVSDGANPTSPVLSGSPTFNGPVSVLFDIDLAGVGLDGGFFNAIGGTAITAFARDGSILGSVTNQATGIEFLGLVTDDGSEKIAGLQFSLVGAEPAGFAIDNLRFGRSNQIISPVPVPEPSVTMAMLVLSGISVCSLRKRFPQEKA